MKPRDEEVESAVRLAVAFLGGRFSAPSDDPYYELAHRFEHFSVEDKLEAIQFLTGSNVEDPTADEVLAALDVIRDGHDFDNWIIGQLIEIRERHPGPEDETTGDLLARAVTAGDEQAKKLIDMGILEMRTSPFVEECP